MGDLLKDIKSRKDQLADAAANTNIGARATRKPDVFEKKAIENDPAKPTKYNTPRDKGESLSAYAARIEALQKK